MKDFYNQFIAELKNVGIDSDYASVIADTICDDKSIPDEMRSHAQTFYEKRLIMVKKAIQSTLIKS